MRYFFTTIVTLSVIFAICLKNTRALSAAVSEGAAEGIALAIRLAGPLCLWSGLSAVMDKAGWSDRLSRWMAPLLRRIYPRAWQDRLTREALCGNFSANLLGLGNAATPPGIRAAIAMARGEVPSDELCRLVVMNTASVQLIPATVAAVRSSLGAAAPFDILPAVWISSIFSVSMGLLAAWVFSKWAD